MPELPEVETIRGELEPVLKGRRLRSVEIRLFKLLKSPAATLRRAIDQARVRGLRRRGKLLLMELTTGWTLVFHLKLSGQLIWQPRRGALRGGGHPIPGGLDVLPNKYSHLIFHFQGGSLYFNDLRQFGFLRVIRTPSVDDWFREQRLGPEVLGPEFRFAAFVQLLKQRPQRQLKVALLDQQFLAGLGNIYADEALFAARLRPTRRLASLRFGERQALFRAIRQVLAVGVRRRGTTMQFFRRPDGAVGGMLPFLKVYGRAGQPCRRCGNPIRKIRLHQRGTHFARIANVSSPARTGDN